MAIHDPIFSLPPRRRGDGPGSSFHIVLVCEDTATAERGLQLYNRLVLRLASEFRVSQSLWQFERLQCPDGLEAGVRDVARADLVVMSMHGDRPLSDGACQWLRSCAADSSGRKSTFVALLDQGAMQGPAPVCEFLKSLALEGGIDLFLQSDGRAGSFPITPWELLAHRFEPGGPRPGLFRWGLNE